MIYLNWNIDTPLFQSPSILFKAIPALKPTVFIQIFPLSKPWMDFSQAFSKLRTENFEKTRSEQIYSESGRTRHSQCCTRFLPELENEVEWALGDKIFCVCVLKKSVRVIDKLQRQELTERKTEINRKTIGGVESICEIKVEQASFNSTRTQIRNNYINAWTKENKLGD